MNHEHDYTKLEIASVKNAGKLLRLSGNANKCPHESIDK